MSQIEIIRRKKEPELFEHYSQRISRIGKKNLCFNEVSDEFIEHCSENSDYLICHTFDNVIRGFSYLTLHSNPKHLYIDLICNSKFHSMNRRSISRAIKYSGKNIIEAIINFGKTLKVKYVKLSAIEKVISFYYKLNFRFIDSSNTNTAFLEELRLAQSSNNETAKEKVLNKIIGKYYKGFYNEAFQSKLGKEKKVEAMDDGIPMIYTYKPQSVCKGKSVKNPNKCRKYKECKIANGTNRSFCRTKKNKTFKFSNEFK